MKKLSKGRFKRKQVRIFLSLTFDENTTTTFVYPELSSDVTIFNSTVNKLQRPLLIFFMVKTS